MSNSSPSRINEDQLEKLLVGVTLGSILVLQLLFKDDKSFAELFLAVHALAFAGLVFFYIKTIPRNYWTALLAGMIIYPLTKVYDFIHHDFQGILYLIQAISFTIAGALFIYHSIQRSKEFKTFEVIGFLLGFLLLTLPLLSLFIVKMIEGFPLLYNFGIAFIIGTIMYGENLWDQYQKGQQKFILLTLIIALTNIIVIASKQF